jgi:hypothetical protein
MDRIRKHEITIAKLRKDPTFVAAEQVESSQEVEGYKPLTQTCQIEYGSFATK